MNRGWSFVRRDAGVHNLPAKDSTTVDLPHTWNALDGQDGGNDYYRGTCWYTKKLELPFLKQDEEVWLEFRGVAMTAEVYVNGQKLVRHEGGYSTFRVNITSELSEETIISVSVDNGVNRNVYPQKADFTFYGGIYRDVYLLVVPKTHFSLDYYGSPAVKVTPRLSQDFKTAEVTVEAWVNTSDCPVTFTIGDEVLSTNAVYGHAQAAFHLDDVPLWDGVDDPYLYTVLAEIPQSSDTVEARFGCRSYCIDPQKGFFLNGRSILLRIRWPNSINALKQPQYWLHSRKRLQKLMVM